jgi:hypothetical protein
MNKMKTFRVYLPNDRDIMKAGISLGPYIENADTSADAFRSVLSRNLPADVAERIYDENVLNATGQSLAVGRGGKPYLRSLYVKRLKTRRLAPECQMSLF